MARYYGPGDPLTPYKRPAVNRLWKPPVLPVDNSLLPNPTLPNSGGINTVQAFDPNRDIPRDFLLRLRNRTNMPGEKNWSTTGGQKPGMVASKNTKKPFNTNGIKNLVPYASNIINGLRRPPAAPSPLLTSPVSIRKPSLAVERTDIDRQVLGADQSADLALGSNAAAAVKMGNLISGLRAKGQSYQAEANMGVQADNQATSINAQIDAQNKGLINNYRTQQVEGNIAQQVASSENVSNAADKYVAEQTRREAMSLDQSKFNILSKAFTQSGVTDRLINQVLKKPYDYVPTEDEKASVLNGSMQALGGRLRKVYGQGGPIKDSTNYFTHKMLVDMDMADRTTGDAHTYFTSSWKADASGIERQKAKYPTAATLGSKVGKVRMTNGGQVGITGGIEDLFQLKDGGWLKGAVNPEHKGFCTPMSKSTCTGHRKAFAEMMKKKHGFHEDGGTIQYANGGTLRKKLNGPGDPITDTLGRRKPILTNNPNDPRLKAYNDSLESYNWTQDKLKSRKSDRGTPLIGTPSTISNQQFISTEGADLFNKIAGDVKPVNILKYNSNGKSVNIFNYKKPVQPVVYQKPQQQIQANSKNSTVEHNITDVHGNYWNIDKTGKWIPVMTDKPQQAPIKKPVGTPQPTEPVLKRATRPVGMNLPNLNTGVQPNVPAPNMGQATYDMSKPTKWSYTYPTGPYNEQKSMYFPDESSFKSFTESNGYTSRQLTKDGGTATGSLKANGGHLKHKKATFAGSLRSLGAHEGPTPPEMASQYMAFGGQINGKIGSRPLMKGRIRKLY